MTAAVAATSAFAVARRACAAACAAILFLGSIFLGSIFLGGIFLGGSGTLRAQDAPPEIDAASSRTDDFDPLRFDSYLDDPAEAGKKALAEDAMPPWYSVPQDAPIVVDLKKNEPEPYRDPADPGHRDSQWLEKPKNAAAAAGTTPRTGLLSNLPVTGLIWTFVVLLVVVLGVVLVWALFRAERSDADALGEGGPDEDEDPLAMQERIEQLPFDVRHGVADFLAEARRLAGAGRYEEALVYLFSHALVQLDRRRRIRLSKGKTNRQYLVEIGERTPLAGVTSDLIDDFEAVFFGKYRLSSDQFDRNMQRMAEFQALLAEADRD